MGLFELAPFCQTDISTYDTQYSLTPPAPTSVSVDSGSTACPTTAPASGEDEAEFDIEVIQAIAPAAGITVWVGPDPAHASETNVLDVYNAMVTSDTTRTNSTSWGDCEQDLSPSFRQSEENIFKQAAAQGQSFFAASGDYGNIDCFPSTGSFKLAVNDPAADPYVTGVGGTTLNLTGSNAYSSETTWNGSGGGLSVVWPRPAWQTGPGVANTYSNGKRQVPDVALDADPNTGYSVYIEAGPYVDTSQDIGWAEIGGTSGGAPAWAAFAALLNQDAVANHKPTLGFANPTLYENQRSNGQFHDVTSGNNDLSGSYGGKYPATAGWDFATGWGSFDANVLAGDLLANVGTDNASVVFNGQPHDWYYDSTFHALRHAVWNGSGWQLETLDGADSGGGGGRTTDRVGRFNAALVYSGQMNDFYYDSSMGALRHAWFDGAWHFETLDGPGCVYAGCGTHSVGQFSAVTLYGNSIQVFYYDATSHAMRHAWWTGSSWNYETLDGSGSGGGSGRTTTDDAGQYNAVTVYGNQVQVYYYDVTSHALRHAWWDTVRWNFETLDGSGSSGGGGRTTTDTVGWNSGVTTYGNQLQIWYYDATTDALRHAWWDTVRWNFEVLDGSGAAGGNGRTSDHVGQYGAVTLYGGLPHVWYLDSDGQSLRHGWWDGGAWRFETLDGLASSYSGHTTDHVGQFNTVAPLSGQLWVWHFDATGSTLRNALWTGSVWQFTTIDS